MKTLAARHTLVLLGLFAATFAATGCNGAARQGPAENPARLATADQEAVRKAVTATLEDLYFDVQTPQVTPQRIDTLPLVSAYPLEFWRKDVRSGEGQAESALHTMRRTVTVQLAEAQGQTSVEVIVRKERLSLPQGIGARTVNESYTVFSSSRKALDNFDRHWGRGETWVDYGRDPALEQYILTEVARRL
jgi:hypothetical protein